jgi:hypothetical protein
MYQKNMVHLSKKPSSNKGNQNAPNSNPFIIILGMMKIVGSIVESHDDQSNKRSKVLLLPPM